MLGSIGFPSTTYAPGFTRSTLQGNLHVSRDGAGGTETPASVIDRFGELGDAGAQHILFSTKDPWQTEQIELLGSTLLTQLRGA